MQKSINGADASTEESQVLVVDDDEIVREYLGCLLTEHGYRASMAADFNEVKTLAPASKFKLIISDLVFLEQSYSGLDVVKYILSLYPDCKAIILTSYPSTHTAVASLRLQAIDYLTKPVSQEDLLGAIRRAFSAELGQEAAPSDSNDGNVLSAREKEVLLHLFQGRAIQDVASMMGCSLATVKTYTQRIYKKLDVHSRTAAIHVALKQGLLQHQE